MLPEIRLEIPGLPRLLALYDRAPAIVAAELRAGMLEAVLLVEGEVVSRTPVDTGRLRGAIASDVEGNGREVRGIVFVSNVPYAPYVEFGTGPREIAARRRKALRIPLRAGGVIFRRRVRHPGTRAARMFRDGAQVSLHPVERIFARRLSRIRARLVVR